MGQSKKSRQQFWRDNEWHLSAITLGELEGDPLHDHWLRRIDDPLEERKAGDFSSGGLIQSSKEIIYCLDDDGKPALLHVTFGLNLRTAEIIVGPTLSAINLDRDGLLRELGLAFAFQVPVVPDTEDLLPELRALERELLTDGFSFGDSKDHRYVLSRYQNVDIDSAEILNAVDDMELIAPSEVRVLLDTMRREFSVLAEAQRVLNSLRAGIDELSALLESSNTNEHALQRCLTRHPVLFGPEYVRIVPKFRLGGDFEMDFALVKGSGLVDLVEIEAAKHELFTKKRDPRAALVHAEQQVLDWLDWVDRFGDLARRNLSGLQRPIGFVVIGRDLSLDEDAQRRLRQRNAVLAPSLEVMTYDGLLRRAEGLGEHFRRLSDAI